MAPGLFGLEGQSAGSAARLAVGCCAGERSHAESQAIEEITAGAGHGRFVTGITLEWVATPQGRPGQDRMRARASPGEICSCVTADGLGVCYDGSGWPFRRTR